MKCVKCNMEAGKFKVTINENGICNYCEYFESKKDDILDYKKARPRFIERIQKFKGKYPYDVVVGLSGGKDSTYVLYQLVKEYGLNVLAITYQNGFLSGSAVSSVENTVRQLGVDHIFYKPNLETHKKLYRACVEKLGDPCIACAFAGYFLAIKVCCEKNIPFFVHGRTPFQMYRNYFQGSNDLFLKMMELNLQEHSFGNLAPTYQLLNRKIKELIYGIVKDKTDADEIIKEFLVDDHHLSDEFVPEFLAFFLFHPYDEQYIKGFLAKEINWKITNEDNLMGHYDCDIHDIAGYMFQSINGMNVLEPDLAVMARFGLIALEDFAGIMEKNTPAESAIELSKQKLVEFCGYHHPQVIENLLGQLKETGMQKFESR